VEIYGGYRYIGRAIDYSEEVRDDGRD